MLCKSRVCDKCNKLYLVRVPDGTSKHICTPQKTITNSKVINKGTGAGGAKTNYYGKLFENKTDNSARLLEKGFVNKGNYLQKEYDNNTNIVFVQQGVLKSYMKKTYNIELFRNPDEAYIISTPHKMTVLILEKKEQHVEGSVETKLWSCQMLRREYEKVCRRSVSTVEVVYGLCVNSFLEDKLKSNVTKYEILSEMLDEDGICVLYGDNDNYFTTLDSWISSHCDLYV
jgi:hypothetical protein